MLIYDLAYVEDKGAYFQVTGLTKNTLSNIIDTNSLQLRLSAKSYQIIKEALEKKQNIKITKRLRTNEVMADEIYVSDMPNNLQTLKDLAMRSINTQLTHKAACLSAVGIVSFTIANNELINEGYFITNKNREEKYIEIIESGNEELIQLLEKYLIILDDIDLVNKFEKKCNFYIDKIKSAESEIEINKCMDDFFIDVYGEIDEDKSGYLLG